MRELIRILSFVSIALAVALFSPMIAADHDLNLGEQNQLLHGYDPVAYFDGSPQAGKHEFSAPHGTATLLFFSASNRSRFLAEPHRFLPAFGGYCAYGVRMGKKFDIDPLAYTIVDGRLYMMLDRATRELWKADPHKNIKIAERIWQSISDKAPDELE